MIMSEIRLVRCPKCDKVLPEPPVFTVYQCGGCGAMLRAKNKSYGSEKLVNSDTVSEEGIEGVKGSGGFGEGHIIDKGTFDMISRSPARSLNGDWKERKSLVEESDLSSSPARSGNVSPSSMRGRGSGDLDFDGVGISPARWRDNSKSPMRERGSRSPMSVRTRHSRSPMRETDAVNRSSARTMNGDIPNSQFRENIVSEVNENAEKEEEGTGVDSDGPEERVKMTLKTSFNTWLPDDNHPRESNDNKLGRRTKWRDRIGDEVDQISEGKESYCADDFGMTSHRRGSSMGSMDRYPRFRDDYIEGNRRSREAVDQQFIGSDGEGVSHKNSRVIVESGRNSASSSEVDGPSNYHTDSVYGYGHSRHSYETHRGSANIHYMERHEFSQNYLGSKHQYQSKQPSDFNDKQFSSPEFYGNADDYSEEEHLTCRQESKQQFTPDNHMPRPSYFNHGPDLVHEMENTYNCSPLYDDPFAGQIKRDHRPNHPQFSHHLDSLKLYRNRSRGHHPACSCSLCDVNDWQAHPTSSRSMNLRRHVPRTYDPRMAHTGPRERPSHLAPHHARRLVVASQNKRICLPIAGGAPFVLCHKCFGLLKLPGKFMAKHKKNYQLQCGSCSSVMSFDLQNRSFDVIYSQKKTDPVNAASGFGEVLNESGPRHHRNSFAATSTDFGSYDFDATGHSFQSMEFEANEASRRRRSVSNFYRNTQDISSSHSSKEEGVSDTASVRNSLHNSSEMPLKIRPPAGSPLREHLDYSSQFHIAKAENATSYTGEEKQVFERGTSQDSSVVYTAVTSDTEAHSYELSTSLSDSGDTQREYKDEGKNTQPSRSSFWRPFASRLSPASPGKGEVYVNGQQVPLHVVKKAEKLAGSIEPGDYWYDPKAGFWGVMGHHCLGIIPPSIQEFSFPMPESCSKGDTAVYVNGRELQKRDLDLLASRGLPTTRNKRYIIDISGKVLEEQTKDFIANLGKLAPTVEKKRCGYGMRVPKEFKA